MILLVFGALGAWAAANMSESLFGLSSRQQLFPAALVVGFTLLVLAMAKRPARQPQTAQVPPAAAAEAPKPDDIVSRLLKEDGTLTPEAARTWLDDFLTEQQK